MRFSAESAVGENPGRSGDGLPRILVIGLGGTIAMAAGTGGGIVPALSASDLVESVPELGRVAVIETVTCANLPSASLSLAVLVDVVQTMRSNQHRFDGFVIVQGTDTIEETAFALDLMWDGQKPLVVTGAMRAPGAPGADGPANLLAAVTVAAWGSASDYGALVVLNDEIHAARFVQKSHTVLVSAFTSPNLGPVGYVLEGRTSWSAQLTRIRSLRCGSVFPPVALVKICLDDTGALLRAVPEFGYAGLVVEAAGAGHVPESLVGTIEAIATAMPVVLATRVPAGPVCSQTYGYAGSEMDLIRRGLIPAGFLPPLKARILLMLALSAGKDRSGVSAVFQAVRADNRL